MSYTHESGGEGDDGRQTGTLEPSDTVYHLSEDDTLALYASMRKCAHCAEPINPEALTPPVSRLKVTPEAGQETGHASIDVFCSEACASTYERQEIFNMCCARVQIPPHLDSPGRDETRVEAFFEPIWSSLMKNRGVRAQVNIHHYDTLRTDYRLDVDQCMTVSLHRARAPPALTPVGTWETLDRFFLAHQYVALQCIVEEGEDLTADRVSWLKSQVRGIKSELADKLGDARIVYAGWMTLAAEDGGRMSHMFYALVENVPMFESPGPDASHEEWVRRTWGDLLEVCKSQRIGVGKLLKDAFVFDAARNSESNRPASRPHRQLACSTMTFVRPDPKSDVLTFTRNCSSQFVSLDPTGTTKYFAIFDCKRKKPRVFSKLSSPSVTYELPVLASTQCIDGLVTYAHSYEGQPYVKEHSFTTHD